MTAEPCIAICSTSVSNTVYLANLMLLIYNSSGVPVIRDMFSANSDKETPTVLKYDKWHVNRNRRTVGV